jgi:hypothetical protein
MAIKVGGHAPHPQNGVVKRKGTQPRPNPTHAGSGKSHGIVHDAPRLPQINSANYAGHKVKRK